jgi:hypothetical protein
MEWFPHPLPTYARWLTTFICCGWAYEAIIRLILIRIGKSSEVMFHCWAANDTLVQWPRL